MINKIEKMPMADFHQDTLNPILAKILNDPTLSYALERETQLPQEGLRKVDLIFSSVYKRINDEMKSEAVRGSEDKQKPIRDDLYKIIEYYKTTTNFKVIERPEDLAIVRNEEDSTNIVLHLEGGDIITDPKIVDELYKRGVRSIGPLYSHDNQIGGGASGDISRGLTPLGRKIIERMLEQGMIIDLAHANQKTAKEILDLSVGYQKTVATHTGLGTDQRFITPELLKKISKSGGVVGFTPAKPFFPTLQSYIENMKRASDIAGSVDNLAVGTDFGGLKAEHLYKDLDEIGKLSIIAEKLSEQGRFSDIEIGKIMYGNIERIVKKI